MAAAPPQTHGAPRVSLPVGNKHVEDLLLWRDVRKSAVVFVGITLLYILLEWSHLSLLRIVSHTLLAIVTVSFLWNNIATPMKLPGLPVPVVVKQGVSETDVRGFAEKATGPINNVLAFVNRIASGHDVLLSVQVAAGLYVFGRLGSYFTSLGLFYTLVVLAFVVPKAYELRKDEIDAAVSHAHKQTTSYYKQYAEPYVKQIPRASTSTNTGSVTAPSKANGGDVADSYTHIAKDNLNAVEGKKAS